MSPSPVNFSRPFLDPSHTKNSNNKRPTREGEGKHKEIANGNKEGREDDDDDVGYDEEDEDNDDDWEDESDGGDDNVDDENEEEDKEEDEEEENDDEYTELFQVLANIARMKAFDERMGNRVETGGTGGWYHGVRYLGMEEFLEGIGESTSGRGGSASGDGDEESFDEGDEGDGGVDYDESVIEEEREDEEGHDEGEGSGEKEGRDYQKNEGKNDRQNEGRSDGENEQRDEGNNEDKKEGGADGGHGGKNNGSHEGDKEGTGDGEQKGKENEDKKEPEEDYVIVVAPGEETDSDDESWCMIGGSDKKKKKGKKIKDTVDNKNSNEDHIDGHKSDNDDKHIADDHNGSDNDEWHDCPLCRWRATTTTPFPTLQPTIRHQPQVQREEEHKIPTIEPSIDVFQTSPTSITVQLAIPGFKRRDISVSYNPNTKALTLSGVLYQPASNQQVSQAHASSASSGPPARNKPFKEHTSSFEADLELWLAYTRKTETNNADIGSDQSQSQSPPQNRVTAARSIREEERVPVGRFSKQVYLVPCSPTSSPPFITEEQHQQHQQQRERRVVDYKHITAKLEDGVLAVVVPLVVDLE